jgi:dynein heavy chain
MAFHARHRWMIQKLNEGFGIHDESFVENTLLKGGELVHIDAFFKKDGPARIVFFHQANTQNGCDNEDGKSNNNNNNNPSKDLFSIRNGDVPLKGKAVWFLKNVAGSAVDQNKGVST